MPANPAPKQSSESMNRAERRARAKAGKGAVTHTVRGGKVRAGHHNPAAAPRLWALRRS
jgi:hypothetical protein